MKDAHLSVDAIFNEVRHDVYGPDAIIDLGESSVNGITSLKSQWARSNSALEDRNVLPLLHLTNLAAEAIEHDLNISGSGGVSAVAAADILSIPKISDRDIANAARVFEA